jgi:ribonuclease PH
MFLHFHFSLGIATTSMLLLEKREIMSASHLVARPIQFSSGLSKQAPGSVLVYFGTTCVQCTASIEASVPRFLKDKKQGWVTAEYSMLPASTNQRNEREAVRGKQSGRTTEIQRLIGRSLRSCINLKALDGYTITIDCDVLNADGSTRTAAITGGCIALMQAIQSLQYTKKIVRDPFNFLIASTSVGLVKNKLCVDLDYQKDSQADSDINVVMNEAGSWIEIQGTAERKPIEPAQFTALLDLARERCQYLIQEQKKYLGLV